MAGRAIQRFLHPAERGFNNHPLNTLLCRAAVALLGTSEFSLRVPNVLMGLVYFTSVYRLARLWFGPSLWMLLTVALNCANPLVLDHVAVARGYGLGLAFWVLGACYVARWAAGDERTWLLIKAGASLGLAVASYLTEAFAVAGLAAAFLLIYPPGSEGLSGRLPELPADRLLVAEAGLGHPPQVALVVAARLLRIAACGAGCRQMARLRGKIHRGWPCRGGSLPAWAQGCWFPSAAALSPAPAAALSKGR